MSEIVFFNDNTKENNAKVSRYKSWCKALELDPDDDENWNSFCESQHQQAGRVSRKRPAPNQINNHGTPFFAGRGRAGKKLLRAGRAPGEMRPLIHLLNKCITLPTK